MGDQGSEGRRCTLKLWIIVWLGALYPQTGPSEAELQDAQPGPGVAEHPVEEMLSPRQVLTCVLRDRSSSNLRLGSSVKPKLYFQICTKSSEQHKPSPFMQRNLGTSMKKLKPTKRKFLLLLTAHHPDAHTQNDLLAHWHTCTWVCTAVLQSRLATAKLLWGLVLRPANFQAICSSWLETDDLTARLSCSVWGHSLALLKSLV